MGELVVAGEAAGDVLVCDEGLSFWGGVDPASGSSRPLTRFEARGQRLGHPIWERIYPHRMD